MTSLMPRHVFVVFTNCTDGHEEEYNTWYNNRHQHDVVNVPGIISCQRLALSDSQVSLSKPSPWKYLAIYEIETEDLKSTLQTLEQRVGTSAMPLTEALDPNLLGWIYHPIGPVVHSSVPS
jgi:hypothetical protein